MSSCDISCLILWKTVHANCADCHPSSFLIKCRGGIHVDFFVIPWTWIDVKLFHVKFLAPWNHVKVQAKSHAWIHDFAEIISREYTWIHDVVKNPPLLLVVNTDRDLGIPRTHWVRLNWHSRTGLLENILIVFPTF